MREVTLYKGEIPGDGYWIVRLVMAAGFADTRKEARQLLSRNKIRLNGERVKSDACINLQGEKVLLEYIGFETVAINIEE